MRVRPCCLLLILALAVTSLLRAQDVALVAEHLYTMDAGGDAGSQGGPGMVLIRDGKVEDVRQGANMQPPKGFQVIRGAYVTPGLIDADTTTGISGAYNIPADQDQDESTDPNTADVNVRDSLNPEDLLYQYVNSYGVTTLQIAPGRTNPIAGRAGIFKTAGPQSPFRTVDQLIVRLNSGMMFNLGDTPKQSYGSSHKAPVTRMKTAEMIRDALIQGKQYQEKWDKWKQEGSDVSKQPTIEPKVAALADVVSGATPAIFNAYRADDIDTAIRIGTEFHLKYMLASVTEGYLIRERIKQAGVPCLVGAVMQPFESLETANATYENAALLQQAGIPIAIMTGYEGYVPKSRVLLFEAAVAAANGLGMESALRAITISPAKILGIDDRVGSLSKGKDADAVVFDGDPFEYTSHVQQVLVQGAVTYSLTRP
jgi:imidazolonepropionase-like amidohydrolase